MSTARTLGDACINLLQEVWELPSQMAPAAFANAKPTERRERRQTARAPPCACGRGSTVLEYPISSAAADACGRTPLSGFFRRRRAVTSRSGCDVWRPMMSWPLSPNDTPRSEGVLDAPDRDTRKAHLPSHQVDRSGWCGTESHWNEPSR